MDTRLKAAGENTNGELFLNGISASQYFVRCDTESVCGNVVRMVAYGKRFAALLSNGKAYLLGKNILPIDTLLVDITMNNDNIFGVDPSGRIYSHGPKEYKLGNITASLMSAAGNHLVVITTDGVCKLITENDSNDICDGAIAAATNRESVYVATKDSLLIYENNRTTSINTPEPICYISCSDTAAYFISVTGNLYKSAGDRDLCPRIYPGNIAPEKRKCARELDF